MKHIFLLWLLLAGTLFGGSLLDSMIESQSTLQYKLNDLNASSTDAEALLNERLKGYDLFFNALLEEREKNLASFKSQKAKVYQLRRKIEINTRMGNTYAVMRDEIETDILKVKALLQEMLAAIITATYKKPQSKFDAIVDEAVKANKTAIETINLQKYNEAIAQMPVDNKIVIQAKENLTALSSLIEIDNALRKYIIAYEDTIYKTAVYSSFGLVSFSKTINDTAIAQQINPFLNIANLDSAKLFLILLIILATLFISLSLYFTVNFLLKRWQYRTEEIELFVKNIRRIVRAMIILYGIDLITDIYLGIGAGATESNKFFTMSYIVLITFIIYRIANTIAMIKIQSIHKKTELYRAEVINLAFKGINFFIFLVGFLIILNVYGFDLTAILSGLGIGSLAVAFAAKDTLANFFGSISILLDNPFSQGDWINVDGKEGTVIEIGLRSTTIRTFDNAMITIPNLTIANADVINWNKRLLGRRIKMHIGVTYESNFDDIKNAIEDIETMLNHHQEIASQKTNYTDKRRELRILSNEDLRGVKKTLLVYLDNFSDSSIDILVYCFTKSVVWSEWLAVKQDVMFKIADILEKNNLSFAYPALSVHLTSDEEAQKKESETRAL